MNLSDQIAIGAAVLSFSGFTIKGTLLYLKTNKEKVKTVFKNPFIIIALLILFISLTYALIPWNKFHYGDEKLIVKHDTIRVPGIDPLMSKSDTQKKQSEGFLKKEKPFVNLTTKKGMHKRDSLKANVIQKTGDGSVAVNGNGNQVANNHSTINNNKPVPREVTDDILYEVKKQLSDKNASISIWRMSDDVESLDFANKIQKSLNDIGYHNVIINGIMTGGQIIGDPEAEHKRLTTIAYGNMMGGFGILIPKNN